MPPNSANSVPTNSLERSFSNRPFIKLFFWSYHLILNLPQVQLQTRRLQKVHQRGESCPSTAHRPFSLKQGYMIPSHQSGGALRSPLTRPYRTCMTSSKCYLAGKITTCTSFELDVKTMAYLILMSVSKLKFWMTAISRSLKC